jgi:mono/diheme cytochrome c family protein
MMNSKITTQVLVLAVAGAVAAGCRGGISKKPPVHPVLDMDFQPKLRAQAESKFYKDGMAMRLAPPGTVARGSIKEGALYHYKDVAQDGAVTWVAQSPFPATLSDFERGRERYNINCAPCHDQTGAGKGLVAARWPTATGVPSFYEGDRVDLPLGRIVGAITDGFTTMPSYAHQVDWHDRWRIAHYIRALQFRMKAKN